MDFPTLVMIIFSAIVTIVLLEMCIICHCLIKIVVHLCQKDDNDNGDGNDSSNDDPDPVLDRNKYQFN